MKDRRRDIARRDRQLIVRLDALARQKFLRFVLLQGGLRNDAPRQTDRIRRHLAVGLRREIVGRNRRIGEGVGGRDAHPPSALGPQVAHTRRERRERVQRFAELVEGERLHVILHVGRVELPV